MEEFHLNSELLLQAFWGGYMCNKNCLKRCQGYFNADVSDFGRGIIEYCVAKNFNIHRIPGYAQYYIKDGTAIEMLHEVPVEKIIMFDECLYHPQNVCANNIHGGEYEVWVMEDNILGKLELDRRYFQYRTLEDKETYDNYFIFLVTL